MKNLEITAGYVPGLIGCVAQLHVRYYAEHWGFGSFFEAKVATELSDFIQSNNAQQDAVFSVVRDGKIEGSVSIDGTSETENVAHLRWFIISDALRGQGAGNRLMQATMTFCRQKQYDSVYLWTFKGLSSSRHLYEKYGFSLSQEIEGDQWGMVVTEQRFDADLTATEA